MHASSGHHLRLIRRGEGRIDSACLTLPERLFRERGDSSSLTTTKPLPELRRAPTRWPNDADSGFAEITLPGCSSAAGSDAGRVLAGADADQHGIAMRNRHVYILQSQGSR